MIVEPWGCPLEQDEAPAIESSEEGPPISEPETAEPAARQWHYLTRLVTTTWALLPRAAVGSTRCASS